MRHILIIVFLLFSMPRVVCQTMIQPFDVSHPKAQQKWVDSVYHSLSLKEKVGQLYMVQVMSNQDEATKNNVLRWIKDHHIGGLIYSSGGPVKQATLNNELQAQSKIPLLIGMDAEWGLRMRLDSTYAFPWNMTLGAVKDNKLIRKTGQRIGEHCKRLGVHFNFAPVVDINTNPQNPIIGNRSFGEDPYEVTQKAMAFMEGMQNAGVLACAKHFPGHGDTDQDSHKILPSIRFSKKRIDSIELYPYKRLIKKGLSSVMVAHLNVPSLDNTGTPSSLSKYIVTDILKEKLGFKGLIFTDALTMKGASSFSQKGTIDLAAFLAGNDVMLMSADVGAGISTIVKAYNKGLVSENRLAHSVKKILKAKYEVGLHSYKPISLHHLIDDLNTTQDAILYEDLIEHAITVLKNSKSVLPLQNLETKRIAYVNLGDDSGDYFFNQLKKYGKVHEIAANNFQGLSRKLQSYNTVIIGLHRSNDSPWKAFEFSENERQWIEDIAQTHTVILDLFVKPYALMGLKNIKAIEAIIMSYQNSQLAQEKSAQLIFGAIAAKGVLPVSTGPHFHKGDGLEFPSVKRLGYTIPNRVGMNARILHQIDSIAQYAIDQKMTPGIQILVAKNGQVVYDKNFGKYTYSGHNKVGFDAIYDIASLTKITATLPLLMELVEQKTLNLDTQLSDILPEYKHSNKAHVTIKHMLSHYARLKPWEPFYTHTLDSITKQPSEGYYRHARSADFNIEVAKNLYLRTDYQDTIPAIIKDSELLDSLKYRYSDFPYYILKKFIETHYNKTLEYLVQDHFYKSIGANYTMYNPHQKRSNKKIVPTEIDDYYRYQEIRGYVHDMGAAMQNGIGGHAGVFSNANDVAKMMQMYLQKGFYGGKRYLQPETIAMFNTCYFCDENNRRGIGFDKPQLEANGPTCGCLSMTSFGHSGFTGAYTWADPDQEVVFVFLANRTYPKGDNNRLLEENIRTEIQRVIYESIKG